MTSGPTARTPLADLQIDEERQSVDKMYKLYLESKR